MIHTEQLKTFLLFIVFACCLLITGCQKPEDVVCTDLSELVAEELIICIDGKEPQLCMAPDSDHCGYFVNSRYIPCKSCYDCDAAAEIAVKVCLGRSPSVDFSCKNQVSDNSIPEKAKALLDAMKYLKESY